MSENSMRVLDFIIAYKRANDGLSPSYREMVNGLGVGFQSTSRIDYHIGELIKQGRIVMVSRQKGIKVIGGSWEYRREWREWH